MILLNDKQLSFDLEPAEQYGLKQKDGEFLRVYYSGLTYGLLFVYQTIAEAEVEKRKFTSPKDYTVEVIPHSLIAEDILEYLKRLER